MLVSKKVIASLCTYVCEYGCVFGIKCYLPFFVILLTLDMYILLYVISCSLFVQVLYSMLTVLSLNGCNNTLVQ